MPQRQSHATIMKPNASPHFERFSATDPDQLRQQLERAQIDLRDAMARDDELRALDLAGEIGSMLTTLRREQEAQTLLLQHLHAARTLKSKEPAGWLLLALATANQYLDHRSEANAQFSEALDLARVNGWRNLEHFVLHHWGRSLVEEGALSRARDCFDEALAIRVSMNLPRQASTRRALEAVATLAQEAQARDKAGNGNAP